MQVVMISSLELPSLKPMLYHHHIPSSSSALLYSRKGEHMRRIMVHQLVDLVDIVGKDCLFYTEITSTIDAN